MYLKRFRLSSCRLSVRSSSCFAGRCSAFCLRPGKSVEDFYESGHFPNVDVALDIALDHAIPDSHDIKPKVALLEAKYRKCEPPKMLKGRQKLWMLFRSYDYNVHNKHVMELQHLLAVKYDGDLRKFQNRWD